MKRHLSLLATGLALVIAAPAQQSAKVQYRSSIYLNVPAEKVPAFLDYQRNVVKKVMQERMNSGENLESWALLALMYRGSPALDYNYISTAVFSGAPPEPNPSVRDQVIKKATSGTYSEYLQKLNSTRQ